MPRPGLGGWTRLVVLLLVVVLVDLTGAFASHLWRGDSPLPLPPLQSLPGSPRPGVDSYAMGGRPSSSWGTVEERRLLNALTRLESNRSPGTDLAQLEEEGLLPKPDDYEVPRGPGLAGSRGLALSFFSRSYQLTGDREWLHAARKLFDNLARFKDFPNEEGDLPHPWSATVDQQGVLWFGRGEVSGEQPLVLVRHNMVVLGMYDFAVTGKGPRRDIARRLVMAGARSSQLSVGTLAVCPPTGSGIRSRQEIETFRQLAFQFSTLYGITGLRDFNRVSSHIAQRITTPPYAVIPIQLREASVDAYSKETLDFLYPASRQQLQPPSVERILKALRYFNTFKESQDRSDIQRAGTAIAAVLSDSKGGLVGAGSPDDVGLPSARAQGLLLSALARMISNTGDAAWFTESARVFHWFPRVHNPPPFVRVTPDTPVGYLRFGGGDNEPAFSPNTLAEHLSATIGILDYWRVTKSGQARCTLAGALTTLDHQWQEITTIGLQDPVVAKLLSVIRKSAVLPASPGGSPMSASSD